MALTEEQVREMFAAAKANGVLLEEAYAYRHAQLAQKVKEIVDSGAIGRIRYLESKHSTFDTPTARAFVTRRATAAARCTT